MDPQTTKTRSFTATIPMPFQGESIVDGIVVSWHVQAGNTVDAGDPLAEIETEKSVWTLESPCAGRIVSLEAEENDIVDVAAPLLRIETSDANMIHLAQSAPQGTKDVPAKAPPREKPRVEIEDADTVHRLSPILKSYLRHGNISVDDLDAIAPTGRNGRITVRDVDEYLTSRRPVRAAARELARTCSIAGLGVAVPDHIVRNDSFGEAFPDLSPEYIEQVTGIVERHHVRSGQTTSDLAVGAARNALDNAGMKPRDIDLIILATSTPDMPLPATACEVQARLGCGAVPAFDLSAACSGWLYGISVATQFIANGAYENILVVAAETMSRFTNPTDRATAFLFGDGAGAAVISGSGDGHMVSNMLLKADPSGYDIIYRRAGGSDLPYHEITDPVDAYWYMDGKRMYQGAIKLFSTIIQDVLDHAGLTVDQVRWIVPHQANNRMWKSVAKAVGTESRRFFSNISGYGNTSAATIPLALEDLRTTEEIAPGDRVLLCSVGAGLTYAGCLVTW